MPRKSSWQADRQATQANRQSTQQTTRRRIGVSCGTHSVNRSKDINRAAQNKSIRDRYSLRSSYWDEQASKF